jgi:hypothetical protein
MDVLLHGDRAMLQQDPQEAQVQAMIDLLRPRLDSDSTDDIARAATATIGGEDDTSDVDDEC